MTDYQILVPASKEFDIVEAFGAMYKDLRYLTVVDDIVKTFGYLEPVTNPPHNIQWDYHFVIGTKKELRAKIEDLLHGLDFDITIPEWLNDESSIIRFNIALTVACALGYTDEYFSEFRASLPNSWALCNAIDRAIRYELSRIWGLTT